MEARNLLETGTGAPDPGYVQKVTRKWSGLCEGVQNPYEKGVLAILLENQMDHLRGLNEETLSTGVGSFTKYIFPILRRVFPNLIANRIVSVQPMTAPVGGIFSYEYKYGDTKGNATANNNLIADFQKFYSSEYIDYQVVVAAGDVDGTKVKWVNAASTGGTEGQPTERIPLKWLPIADVNTSKGITGATIYWTLTGSTTLKQRSVVAGGANAGTGDGTSFTVDLTTGAWELDATGDIPKAGDPIYVAYYYDSEKVGTTTVPGVTAGSGNTANAFANADQVAKIPEVNIDISLSTVTAVTRKLKARWSAEAVDDLRAFHGINAETELVAGISNEIALELDREIINDLVSGAGSTAAWNYGAATLNNSSLEQIRSLLTVIESVSANIHKRSLRAPANWIVTSPAGAAMLAQLTTNGDFSRSAGPVESPNYGVMNSNFGITQVGTLMNKYMVYQDPFLASDNMLVGLKGQSFLDAGYVYAPYVPLQVTPTFLDPDDFTFRKGLRTRYAKKMLRPEYYGLIKLNGLPTVTNV